MRHFVIHTMKKLVRPALVLGICLSLALLSARLTYSFQPTMQGSLSATTFFLQPTTTPQPQDVSEVGSTDGIVAMAGIIVLIVIVPILLRRKHWMRSAQQ
jgi:hypothetical protein